MSATPDQPTRLRLVDYRKPDFLVPEVSLDVIIQSNEKVRVTNNMRVVRQTAGSALELLGENQVLESVKVGGRVLAPEEYRLSDSSLVIENLPEGEFTVEVVSTNNPKSNTKLSGLYQSGDHLVTQMEALGFRRFTFHPDKPDVMSTYTTRVEADRATYPVILSNGNLKESGDLENGRHFAVFEDPFKKPSYLFALVAGDLEKVTNTFQTMSGRTVDIEFYVDKGDGNKARHAIESLKSAMKWDEERFGLECDLDRYSVVSVGSFNFGAMENKGLNIFNSALVLANPETATDDEFERIEGVIGHEYFHNWTGNRVTLRSWFELTLKEGLTVYRDQEFSSDLNPRVLKRIQDVSTIRNAQFAEDSGPNAHPIRPAEVGTIENFYTVTVYNKGAEVIRMVATLIGREAFRRGMDEYFRRHDGQAVTTDDFIGSMEAGSGKNLKPFKRWYEQAGTPEIEVSTDFDPVAKTYSIIVKQSNKTKAGEVQEPLHIPFTVGLVGVDGKDLVTRLYEVTEREQTFVFEGINEKPTPSLLRNFSAPVKVKYAYTDEDLAFLLVNDQDQFNRWDAGQRLFTNQLYEMIKVLQSGGEVGVKEKVIAAYGAVIADQQSDPAFTAKLLDLPAINGLIEDLEVADYESAVKARRVLKKEIALIHEARLVELYDQLNDGKPYSKEAESVGRRALKNMVLSYLVETGKGEHLDRAHNQFETADNMTDSQAALSLLTQNENQYRSKVLEKFHDRWKDNELVMDKWITAQASSDHEAVIDDLSKLVAVSPIYNRGRNAETGARNPNRVKALVRGFLGNHLCFHHSSGSGYKYLGDLVIDNDKTNPQLAAQIATGFKKYASMDPVRQARMKTELQRILDANPSENTYEIVSKTLASVQS